IYLKYDIFNLFMERNELSFLDDNGGRLYAGYADAYKGYEPELLLLEGSFSALDEVKPPRIIAREAIEKEIRATPRVTTYYPTGPVRAITTIPDLVIPPERVRAPVIEPIAELPSMELAGMSQLDIWELLDVMLPEELLGLDITPGRQVGKETKGRVYYDNVWIENGKVKCVRKGEQRTLGYTPRFAKKKYKTRRRRKRLTKRDMYILEVLKANPEAGALALML
ncbi:unnamed protein product, partial [marine sediment metagenome]